MTEKNNKGPSLTMSRQEAEIKISERINKGWDLYDAVDGYDQLHMMYRRWNEYNIDLLKTIFDTDKLAADYQWTTRSKPYDPFSRGKSYADLKDGIRDKVNALESLKERMGLFHEPALKSDDLTLEQAEGQKIEMKKVFVIHGHDNEMRKEVQLFLQRIKLDDIVLHECEDIGLNIIINKLIKEGSTACYAIALLSPDDITENGEARARQNVIFEIGYFLGKIGEENVKLLVKDNVEMPSDLHGVIYESYDDKGAWRIKLAKAIKKSGLPVDMDGLINKF